MSAPKKTTPNLPPHHVRIFASHTRLIEYLLISPPSFLPANVSYGQPPPHTVTGTLIYAHTKLLISLLNHTARTLLARESRLSGTLLLQQLDTLLCNILTRYRKLWKEPNEMLKVQQVLEEAITIREQMQLFTQQEKQYKEAWEFVRGLGEYVRELIWAEAEASGAEEETVEKAFWGNAEMDEGVMLKGVITVWLGGKMVEFVGWELPGEDPIF